MTDQPAASVWLWLEPYVHLALKQKTALLYNSLSGAKLEYQQPAIIAMLKRMEAKENLRVVAPTAQELQKPLIQQFIHQLKTDFMGDTAAVASSGGKPVQLMPQLSLFTDIAKKKKHALKDGKSIMAYLSELTLFINNYAAADSPVHGNLSTFLYRQFIYPYVDSGAPRRELEPAIISKILAEIKESGIYNINIVGGDIFQYTRFEELLTLLSRQVVRRTFHVHYLDALASGQRLRDIGEDNTRVVLYVPQPVQEEKLAAAVSFARSRSGVSFVFPVASETDVATCERLSAQFAGVVVQYKPYFNGENISFFRQFVFIDKEQLREANPSQKEIMRRSVMNTHAFGKLVILSNGAVYAGVNAGSIGQIRKHTLHEVIYRELFRGRSWLQTRARVRPCGSCLYNFLCPSPTAYEYVMGRHNLCHIRHSADNSILNID